MLAPARESARCAAYKVHRPPITLEKTEQVPMALFLVYGAVDGGAVITNSKVGHWTTLMHSSYCPGEGATVQISKTAN